MKSITRTKSEKTILSVQPGKISLSIGSDLSDDKLRDFLQVVDDMLVEVIDKEVSCYGHFSFSKDKVEITLSKNSESPSKHDLTYRRSL